MLKTFALVFVAVQLVAAHNPHLKTLSVEEAERLASWTKDSKQRMWELSGQVEGDMVLLPGQKNGLIDTYWRWLNMEIPYDFGTPNNFSPSQMTQIENSLREFEERSCVRVRRRTAADPDYVVITSQNTGCWSYVGRLRGAQELNLQPNGCVWHDTIVHEFLHAAGFYHQQSATERDDYVQIHWENIQSGMEHNFDKFGADLITSFGQPYDYASIMHYTPYSFSSNGLPTITAWDPNAPALGSSQVMTPIDSTKLNIMYC